MASINQVPDHLLITIFSYLESSKDTNQIRLVCHRWNNLMLNVWSKEKTLTLKRHIKSPQTFLEYIKAYARRYPHVKQITIEPVDRSVQPNVIANIPSHYGSIGKLFRKLEKLIFYDNLMEDKALLTILKQCTQLKSMCLYSCYQIHDCGLIKALEKVKLIKELEIIACPEVTAEVVGHCHNLINLVFDTCQVDNTILAKLADSGGEKNLEKLETSPLSYDNLCLISQRFPKLKRLFIPEFDDEDIFKRHGYVGFPLLETLCLTYGSVSDRENLKEIICKCPSIRVLWIWNCVNRTVVDFIDEILGQLEDKIVHLVIDDLKGHQIDALNLRHFGKLKKLTIIGSTLKNETLQRIIDAAKSLTHLDISDSIPPNLLEIKAKHEDFWFNSRPVAKRASCLNIEPPFRSNYANIGDNYFGPVLEIDCHPNNKPKYLYMVSD